MKLVHESSVLAKITTAWYFIMSNDYYAEWLLCWMTMTSDSYAEWRLRWMIKMTNMLHRFTSSVLNRWYLNTWKEKTILFNAYFIDARSSASSSRLFSEKVIRARWHDLSRMKNVWSRVMKSVWSRVMKRARSKVMKSARTMLNDYYVEWLFNAFKT